MVVLGEGRGGDSKKRTDRNRREHQETRTDRQDRAGWVVVMQVVWVGGEGVCGGGRDRKVQLQKREIMWAEGS